MKSKNNKIRLSESQLRTIVRENIEDILNEAYNQYQYAHLAGQANGALSTLGGKIKGLFNPKWKARKQRQEKLFGNEGDSWHNVVGSHSRADISDSLYDYDYFNNAYNHKLRGKRPYEITRTQYDRVRRPNGGYDLENGGRNGQTMPRKDFSEKYGFRGKNIKGADDVAWDNSMLNSAYEFGRNAAMGKYKKGAKTSGGTSLTGTGTRNGMFQYYGEED